MKMKRPKNLEKYSPAPIAAETLRNLANRIERDGGFVRWSIRISFWNDDWLDDTKPAPPMIQVGATMANK